MVTVTARIGYAFSRPLGPLTMKLAETPSRSAGLIISVFGVPSSPMTPSQLGLLNEPGRGARGYGGAPVRSRSGRTRRERRAEGAALLASLVHLLRIGAGLPLRLVRLRGNLVLVLR